MADLALGLMVRPLPGSSLVEDVTQVWRNAVARRARRRALRRLARLDDRLIADVGIDPDEVHALVANSWDEFRPGLMQRSAPWI